MAALSVICVHFYLMALHASFLPSELSGWAGYFLATLWHGVDLFFIISGFLIPASLERHGNLKKFFVDRCLRILPLFVFLHLIVFSAGPLIGYKFFRGIAAYEYAKLFFANLFFLAPIFDIPLAQQNAWTLTYEWAFYITTAAGYFLYLRHPKPFLFAIFSILTVLCVYIFPITIYFCIGAIFSRISVRFRLNKTFGLWVSVVAIVFFYYSSQYISIFVGVLPAILIFAIVLDNQSYLAQFLQTRVMQFLGKISYSFYLVHPFALYPYQKIFEHLAASGYPKSLLFVLFVLFGLLTSLIIATVTYYLIEEGLQKAIRRSLVQPAWTKMVKKSKA